MANYNTSSTTAAQSTSGLSDPSGVPVVSTANTFGASPLGVAARTQALYGVANGQFNLLPIDTNLELANTENPLPYWSINNFSGGRIVAKSFFDTTTKTWGVELNPTAGSANDYITLTTRSYVLTDDNIALRQQAYLTTSKGTAYAGTTQFNVTLTAEYFDISDTSLSSYAIGTALDNSALTGISGVTTSGSAAISASASYVDLTIKLTCTATVSSGVKVYLKSLFLATASAVTGSFKIAETFLSSGTWTRPTGVDYVDVVVLGAGGGGASGVCVTQRNATPTPANEGDGGGGGQFAILRDVYVGDVSTVSIGVGAGGAGGIGTAISKAAASSAVGTARAVSGANGGATTFGAYISVPGGGAGTAKATPADGSAPGSAGGTPTSAVYGVVNLAAGAGVDNNIGGTAAISAFAYGAPYTTLKTGGTAQAGGSATATGGATRGTATPGTGNVTAGLGAGGGSGARIVTDTAGPTVTVTFNGYAGGPGGGGGGGGAVGIVGTVAGTQTATAGAGGTALANSGSGGGGGGCAAILITTTANYDAAVLTVTPGNGGAGAAGFVTVVYTA